METALPDGPVIAVRLGKLEKGESAWVEFGYRPSGAFADWADVEPSLKVDLLDGDPVHSTEAGGESHEEADDEVTGAAPVREDCRVKTALVVRAHGQRQFNRRARPPAA